MLPESLQLIRPRSVVFGIVILRCVCNNIWLQNWLLSAERFYDNTRVLCHTSSGVKSVLEVDKDILCCGNNDDITRWIIICIGICLCCMIIFIFIINILIRDHFRLLRKTPIERSHQYEEYISCNEQDDNLRHLISYMLLPYLKEKGVSVFLPYRDCRPGTPREDEIREKISKSKNVLIILSEVYDDTSKRWLAWELRYSWIHYRRLAKEYCNCKLRFP